MSIINAADVKRLRDQTSAPMMDCKSALTEAAGDFSRAVKILRERNAHIATGKAEREAAEGRVEIYVTPDQSAAVIDEVRCESAPVAKAEGFKKLCADIAQHLAEQKSAPANVDLLLGQKTANG